MIYLQTCYLSAMSKVFKDGGRLLRSANTFPWCSQFFVILTGTMNLHTYVTDQLLFQNFYLWQFNVPLFYWFTVVCVPGVVYKNWSNIFQRLFIFLFFMFLHCLSLIHAHSVSVPSFTCTFYEFNTHLKPMKAKVACCICGLQCAWRDRGTKSAWKTHSNCACSAG